MCLATVYKNSTGYGGSRAEKCQQEIYVEGSSVRLVDIMGAEVVIEGSISFVDLANSVVKLNCPAA